MQQLEIYSKTLIFTDTPNVRTSVHNVGKQSISFMATDKKKIKCVRIPKKLIRYLLSKQQMK